MECRGTAKTQSCFIEHLGIPTLAALRQAMDAMEDMNMKGRVQLIISGGVRTGADVAKALAMGADAVSIGQGVLIALVCSDSWVNKSGAHIAAEEDWHCAWLLQSLPYRKIPSWNHYPGYCSGTSPHTKSRRQEGKNYLNTLVMELTTIARACGKIMYITSNWKVWLP